jgi:hypothetical protein
MNPAIEPLKKKINSLRPAWAKLPHFTAMEMHALHGAIPTLESMQDEDWDLVRAYFAYTPKGNEKHYPVTKRSRFLDDPSGTLAAAEDWAKTHREDAKQAKHATKQGHWR